MKKKICSGIILLAFVLQSVSVWSATINVSPVYLYYKSTPKLDGNPRPSRAPAKFNTPFTVYIDESKRQLSVTSIASGDFTYFIYNDSGEILTQGILDCVENTNHTIDLWSCQSGIFIIVFIYNGNTYEGTFEVGE